MKPQHPALKSQHLLLVDPRNGARLHPTHPVILEAWKQIRSGAALKGWRRRRARAAAKVRWSKR